MQFEVDVLIWPVAHSSLFWPVCSQWRTKCICSLYERGKYRHRAMVLHLSSWVRGIKTGETPIITHPSSPIKFSTVIKIECVVTRQCITTTIERHIAYVWGLVTEVITHLCFYICAWPKFPPPFISRLHRYLSGPAPRLSAYPRPKPGALQEQRRVCRNCRTASHCQLPHCNPAQPPIRTREARRAEEGRRGSAEEHVCFVQPKKINKNS